MKIYINLNWYQIKEVVFNLDNSELYGNLEKKTCYKHQPRELGLQGFQITSEIAFSTVLVISFKAIDIISAYLRVLSVIQKGIVVTV